MMLLIKILSFLLTLLLLRPGAAKTVVQCTYSSKPMGSLDSVRNNYLYHRGELPNYMDETYNPEAIDQYEDCGTNNYPRMFEENIISGLVAQDGAFPWMALYQVDDKVCGGALISQQWVLTAAACLVSRKPGKVILGQTQLHAHDAVTIDVDFTIRQDDYNNITRQANLALLKLKKKVHYTDKIKPICMLADSLMDATPCYVSGWGITSHKKRQSPRLQYLKVTKLDQYLCFFLWQVVANGDVDDQNICLDLLSNTDLCYGDVGSPLVCALSNKFYLTGVVSYGDKKCHGDILPPVTTAVYPFLEWITEKVNRYS
ncbi:chymotrypsin-like protease CTRL-1 [Physella acuta]|uniref:chymotrypsin-like protease CTRL-1 n=1 Tax=Physella acuta TaxID=109671 RepID=UPI0027DE5D19|nr:chymotrypsin-like protease CTRL-1 [Physella acuta]XP_059141547.1 chymotrypsin-like protease CTRL-1 [Physella acuta]XP_059141548.1 chymotrypsin-like protease CTRL-1 [Physella acuta]